MGCRGHVTPFRLNKQTFSANHTAGVPPKAKTHRIKFVLGHGQNSGFNSFNQIQVGTSPEIYSGVLSGTYSGILFGMCSDTLSVRDSGILVDTNCGLLSGVHSGIQSGVLSGTSFGVISGMWFWRSIWRLRSCRAHCDLKLAVRRRRGGGEELPKI